MSRRFVYKLKQGKFWGLASQPIQDELLKIGRLKIFQPGSIVFSNTDPFSGVFLIESGKFKIYNINENGKEAIIAVVNEGDLIACPMLFIDPKCYPSIVEAIEYGTMYYFEKESFKNLLYKNPEFMFRIVRLTMYHVFEIRNKVTSLMLLNIDERIVQYLKELGAEKEYVSLPIPKNQLALLIGTTPETITRCFKKLEKEKVILVNNTKYMLGNTKNFQVNL